MTFPDISLEQGGLDGTLPGGVDITRGGCSHT